MIFNKKLAVAVSGAVLLMAGQFALADSTTDIVDALVSKGVLTEEEGKLISKGATSKAKADEKANKSRISVGSFIDNATIYGNFRARYEYRDGEGSISAGNTATQVRQRARGKFELGAETKAGNWYSDIAFVTGSDASGRSDNFTFGAADSGTSYGSKESIYLKRAMLGWNATDWLTLEAGRMKNPLYTTPMMWDGDWSVSGLTQKIKYKYQDTDLFVTVGEWAQNKIDRGVTDASNTSFNISTNTAAMYALQAGFVTPIKSTSLKAAATIYGYDHGTSRGTYNPGVWNEAKKSGTYGVDNLNVLEIPAELNFMATDSIGMRIYGDYAQNFDADARAREASAVSGGPAAAANGSSGSDDKAWLVGIVIASAKDLKSMQSLKPKAGDYSLNLWYQSIGVWATDQGLGDSDIFDSRVNTEGFVAKAQYNFEDNVALNLTGGWGSVKNKTYGTPYTAGADLSQINIDDFTLYQADLTYRF